MQRHSTEEKRYRFVRQAIEQENMNLLSKLWFEDSPEKPGPLRTRRQITEAVPKLAEKLGLPGITDFFELQTALRRREHQQEITAYEQSELRPNEFLKLAAIEGNWQKVNLCEEVNGSELNWNDGLEGAALNGDRNLIKHFIRRGARIFSKPALAAAQGGHLSLVSYFLNKIRNSLEKEWVISRLALSAAIGGHYDLMYKFTEQYGMSPFRSEIIEIAASEANREVVLFLMEEGVGEQSLRDFGLRGAAKGGHFSEVEYFIELGASLEFGMEGACEGGHLKIIEFLHEEKGVPLSEGLLGAVRGNKLEIVKHILSREEPVDLGEPFFLAVEIANREMVDLFVDRYFDILEEQGAWQEAFLRAVRSGELELIKEFIGKAGHHTLNKGLVLAAELGYKDVVTYLIAMGANNLDTAALSAFHCGQDWLVPLFLEKGARNYREYMTLALDAKNRPLFIDAFLRGADSSLRTLYSLALKPGPMGAKAIRTLQKQATNPNDGLILAALGGHEKAILHFLEKGATNTSFAKKVANNLAHDAGIAFALARRPH